MAGHGKRGEGIATRVVIEGVVQGVGFRPFVYRLARRLGVRGCVSNIGGAVEIIAAGDNAAEFLRAVEAEAPQAARIERVSVTSAAEDGFDGFKIIGSREAEAARFVPPDLSVCDDCLRDIRASGRRRGHFFCSCAHCGPRYTIIDRLPYDRPNTAMAGFALCAGCAAEYGDPDDRRFHAETVCCNDCGVSLLWLGEREACGAAAFDEAAGCLKNGGIAAIKGVGGYHLACSPFDEAAVAALRRLKRREAKPLAVMFRDMGALRAYADATEAEAALATSSEKPITLLKAKRGAFAPSLLNGDARVGAFLPYTPLHALLLEEAGALALTSANVSGSAIITNDRDAADLYNDSGEPRFGGVLYNDRAIRRSAEDSVAQAVLGKPQILRRSRGFAPSPVKIGGTGEFFAAGGDLKAAFCLAKGGYAYQSPYFGDLEDADVYERYTAAYADLTALLGIAPTAAVRDMHPGYFSAGFAASLGLPVIAVQHHHAHAAAAMAEHGLTDALAVCFDGTGYGDDGAVWGGEFLLVDGAGYTRVGQLGYVTLAGGDAAARDAHKTARCYLIGEGYAADDTPAAAMRLGVNTARYSSAGRLFDAVAAVLGLCGENGYEGQCAIALQQAAERAAEAATMELAVETTGGRFVLNQARLVRDIYERRQEGADAAGLALGFHHALARGVAEVCARAARGTRDVALTGGVFQNSLLTGLCRRYIGLADGRLRVHIHEKTPPNDNGLAIGQAWVAGRGRIF